MDQSEQARRTKQNILDLSLLVVIVLAGALLFRNFIRSAAMLRCVRSGRQDCVQGVEL
jgi:hypothetical protein